MSGLLPVGCEEGLTLRETVVAATPRTTTLRVGILVQELLAIFARAATSQHQKLGDNATGLFVASSALVAEN